MCRPHNLWPSTPTRGRWPVSGGLFGGLAFVLGGAFAGLLMLGRGLVLGGLDHTLPCSDLCDWCLSLHGGLALGGLEYSLSCRDLLHGRLALSGFCYSLSRRRKSSHRRLSLCSSLTLGGLGYDFLGRCLLGRGLCLGRSFALCCRRGAHLSRRFASCGCRGFLSRRHRCWRCADGTRRHWVDYNKAGRRGFRLRSRRSCR